MQRAEKAAALLERGFTGGAALSWLLPASFGSVESLQPINAEPANLRDEICGKGGRRRPRSDNEEEPVAHTPNDTETPLAAVAAFQLGPRPQGSLLGPLTPSMAPIPVYAGVARQPANLELASAPPKRKKVKQPAADAATAVAHSGSAPKPTAAAKPAVAPKQTAPKQASAHATATPNGNGGTRSAASKPAEQAPAAKPKAKPKAKPVAAQQQ
jgi:hypothetical protein